jgi:hypothetical protein
VKHEVPPYFIVELIDFYPLYVMVGLKINRKFLKICGFFVNIKAKNNESEGTLTFPSQKKGIPSCVQ